MSLVVVIIQSDPQVACTDYRNSTCFVSSLDCASTGDDVLSQSGEYTLAYVSQKLADKVLLYKTLSSFSLQKRSHIRSKAYCR
jgi:hypothetical protein